MGGTLAWDDFHPVPKDFSPRKGVIPSATVSMEDLLCTSSFPANTSTVAEGLDKLLSAIPPAKLVFNASPIQEVTNIWLSQSDWHVIVQLDESKKEGSSLMSNSVGGRSKSNLSKGPNTSTPADELDGNSTNRLVYLPLSVVLRIDRLSIFFSVQGPVLFETRHQLFLTSHLPMWTRVLESSVQEESRVGAREED